MAADIVQGSHHNCQRFCRASLADAQGLHCTGCGRVASKVKAPQPFDGQDLAREQQFACHSDRGIARVLSIRALLQPDVGTANRAGVGLGVEPAVEWIIVFALAVRAHGKGRHGGQGPVVGDIADDGEARPAVGAVGKGIAVAAVIRVQ